ncbi:MAG TPA: NAD-binding protein [Gaiellales bacterium]|nr:NAD-binding protein [Gaiellales bacterium]
MLEAFSRDVMWLGEEPGLGSRLKLVANHWILVTVENLVQTVAFAEALDLDPRRFLELISGAPFDMQYAHWKAAMMLEGEFPVAFALKLARKDMQLALEAAATAGIELAMAAATEKRLGRDGHGTRRGRQRRLISGRPPHSPAGERRLAVDRRLVAHDGRRAPGGSEAAPARPEDQGENESDDADNHKDHADRVDVDP